MPTRATCPASRSGRRSRSRRARRRSRGRSSRPTISIRICSTPAEQEQFSSGSPRRRNEGLFTPIGFTRHDPHAGQQRRIELRQHLLESDRRHGLRHQLRHPGDHPAARRRRKPRRAAGTAAEAQARQRVRDSRCSSATARSATAPIAPARRTARRSSASRPALAEEMRRIVTNGKGRMPPFPHLMPADVDAVVSYLVAADAAGRGGRGRGGDAGCPRRSRRARSWNQDRLS